MLSCKHCRRIVCIQSYRMALKGSYIYIILGIGVGMFNQLFLITIYYILINAWTMFYMTSSFLSPLPWTSCDNEWNTPRCIREDKGGPSYNNETTYNMSISISTTNVNESYDLQEKNGSLTSWENQTSEKEFWL